MKGVRGLHLAVAFVTATCLALALASSTASAATAGAGTAGDLVFTYADGQPGLFIVHADGSGLRRLTTQVDSAPAWSPNGRSIAFTRAGSVWVLTLGHAPRRMTAGSDPTWSADGTRLAYTRVITGRLTDIFVVPASGGTPHRVTFAAVDGCSASQPAWSPLGPIAFVRTPGTGSCAAGIAETSVGGPARTVVPDPTAYGPSYTSDGRHLLYVAVCDANTNGDCNTIFQAGWEATATGAHQHIVAGNDACEEGESCLYTMAPRPGGGWVEAADFFEQDNDVYVTCYRGGRETADGLEAVPPTFCLTGETFDFSIRAARRT